MIRILVLTLIAVSVTTLTDAQTQMYRVTSASGVAGSTQTVSFLTDTAGPLDGWSFGLCHDPTVAAVVSAALGSDAAAVNPVFTSIETGLTGGVTVGSLVSFVPPFTQLLPGQGLELLVVTYQLVGAPGAISPLEPCGTLGSPPVALLQVVDGVETIPAVLSATLEILAGPMFIRGDANGDSVVNLIDAIRVLELVFGGIDPITCQDQLDSNDDEIVNIVDVIFLLEVAVLGTSVMPSPFPACGLDATDTGAADCAQSPLNCP